jgi:homoaconitase/3-isopropylmalate dehydratase large subunit
VPETVRVNLTGRLNKGITIRDVSQRMIVDIGEDNLDYSVVEYGGPALKDIDFGGRMTLCNNPLEMGAKSALIETDERMVEWLKPRVKGEIKPQTSDPDAVFKSVYDYDLGCLEPQVAAPPRPDNVVGVSKVAGIAINHAFIGSCANGSIEDLRDAASIDLVHFGIIMIVNLQIGVLLPPIGASALVASRMAGISFETQVRALVPFIALGLVTLMFVTYIPQLSLWVPSYFGGR